MKPLQGRIALWGWGREGHAAYAWLRSQDTVQTLHVFCTTEEVAEVNALNDAHLSASTLTDAAGAELAQYDWVIKSPGISPYQPAVLQATHAGTRFIAGTWLWANAVADANGDLINTICITGTKGKSTTSALLAHLLRADGKRTLLAGNIGLPLLESLVEAQPVDYRVVELSSYQTRDLANAHARPAIAIVVNIFPEHLDWHGSEEQYVSDKLALLTGAKPHVAVLNAEDATLSSLHIPDSQVVFYGDLQGWHLRNDDLYHSDDFVMDTSALPLPGRHNRGNLCAALTALDALGLDGRSFAQHATTFMPLPNRLQPIGTRNGIAFVNDSIATTPHATLAALSCYATQRVALIVGGYDRGLDWGDFALHMQTQAPACIVTMGQKGPQIHALLDPIARQQGFALLQADTLVDANEQAVAFLGKNGGVVLLSPGAPSFGQYKNYVERGKDFARMNNFDPELITNIPGLGFA